MDRDSFIINLKTDVYEDIANDVNERFDISNKCGGPLSTGKNKNVISLKKDELGETLITVFVALRPKNYSYLMDDSNTEKKAKGRKKCVIKRRLQFNDYKDLLLKQ